MAEHQAPLKDTGDAGVWGKQLGVNAGALHPRAAHYYPARLPLGSAGGVLYSLSQDAVPRCFE
jgi:hypothetical protein